MSQTTPYALVLGGGGSKGAYQVGAMQAIQELKLPVNAVIGTSVGALNAAFWATGQLREADAMWRTLTLDGIIRIPASLMKDGHFQFMHKNTRDYIEFRASIFKEGGADTSPLRALVTKYLKEDAIRRCGIDFGVVSFQLGGMKPLEYFLEDIPQGKMVDYLMASAAFPGFKVQKLDQRIVLDGGLADNVPFNLAKRRGYHRIIVVDVSGLGVKHKPDVEMTETIYIRNSGDLGGIMDFDPAQSLRNIQMGYLDTLKVLGRIQGLDYYYHRDARMEKRLMDRILDPEIRRDFQRFLPSQKGKHQNIELQLREILPERWKKVRNILYPLLECAAHTLGIERVELYDFRKLVSLLQERHKQIQTRLSSLSIKPGFIDRAVSVLEKTPDLLSLGPVEYDRIMDYLLGSGEVTPLHSRALSLFTPELLGARVFLAVIGELKL